MSELHDPFFPQHVDESIEQLASHRQTNDISNAIPHEKNADACLIQDLQKLYGDERKRYQQALQRVEGRLIERSFAQKQQHNSVMPITSLPGKQWNTQKRRRDTMKKRPSFGSALTSIGGRVSLVAVTLILIGSIVVVFNYVHQGTTQAGPRPSVGLPTLMRTPTPMPTPALMPTPMPTPALIPTPMPIGKTLYTTPGNNTGFNGLAWSPDSKRIASSSQDVQIWDALDGQHQVSVQMPNTNEWASGLDWSPNSQQLAIATSQEVLIVDSQNGKVIQAHAANQTAIAHPTSPGTSYLSSQFPDSGGPAYNATSWSPDGKLLALARSFGSGGEIQIWNPLTDKIDFSIQDGDAYNVGALSWSSDGDYIAASEWNTQGPTGLNQPTGKVVVWQVSTQKIVFQHEDIINTGDPVVWQPKSHLLAFGGENISNGNIVETIEIWDMNLNKQVKQYPGDSNGGLAWSPDGNYLAYGSYEKQNAYDVIIQDITTDKQAYVYKNHKKSVSVIAWSPDGQYIASGEGHTSKDMQAQVWSAGSLSQE